MNATIPPHCANLLARRFAIFPVRERGKEPLTSHGFKDATRDGVQIAEWSRCWPGCNWGVALGAPSGCFVLDFDTQHGLAVFEQSYGKLPPTYAVKTSRGSHLYFLLPRSGMATRKFDGGELRSDGAYVVAEGSIHPSGALYQCVSDAPIAECPPKLLDQFRSRHRVKLRAHAPIPEGERNETLTSLAGTMRRRGMSRAAIAAALRVENAAHCSPPLPEVEVEAIAASVSRYAPGRAFDVSAESEATPEKVERESAATALVKLAQASAELFHFGEDCFATVEVTGHKETYALKSRGFRCWLNRLFFEQQKRTANGEAVTTAITTLEGFARFEGVTRAAFVRVAEFDGNIYLDLCDNQWRVVEIASQGWRIVESKDCPVRFRRAHGMLALPVPERGGSISELWPFLNVRGDDDFVQITGWLVATFHPSGPYPVLVLHGEQGSAKSTTARLLRALSDPNSAPLRSEPREPRDLMVAASHGWICALDNLSRLPDWLSDGLCRLSTGGGFSTRSLYTDDEEKIFEAKRPVILTGIEEWVTRGDLLDRSLIAYLPRIAEEKCQTEREFLARFEAARPRLLGALLDAASSALANRCKITFTHLPRMADFAVWVTAAEPALGWESGRFLRVYAASRAVANEIPLETPVADALRRLALPWQGTMTRLLKALCGIADEKTRQLRSWPTSGQALSNALRRLAPNLRHAGIEVSFDHRQPGTGRRIVKLSENGCNSSSQASQPPEVRPFHNGCDTCDSKSPESSDGGGVTQ